MIGGALNVFYESNSELYHYGIKGQKHGVRRFQNLDGSLTAEGKIRYGVYDRDDGTKDMDRLKKDAAKDAKEWAKAKAYYGEGAGNRRKKIKNALSEKMKDPDYKAEFDKQVSNQDMAKVQKQANFERKSTDAKKTAKKVGRTAKRFLFSLMAAGVTVGALEAAGYGPSKVINRSKSFIRQLSAMKTIAGL